MITGGWLVPGCGAGGDGGVPTLLADDVRRERRLADEGVFRGGDEGTRGRSPTFETCKQRSLEELDELVIFHRD